MNKDTLREMKGIIEKHPNACEWLKQPEGDTDLVFIYFTMLFNEHIIPNLKTAIKDKLEEVRK